MDYEGTFSTNFLSLLTNFFSNASICKDKNKACLKLTAVECFYINNAVLV